MRKYIVGSPYNTKENKYDQTTNLGIDIETQLNKSVVLPKIASKMIDQEYRDFIGKRKNQQEKVIQSLRDEVTKLKKYVYHLQQKRMVYDQLRTEESEPFTRYDIQNRRRPQISHHTQNNTIDLRSSEFVEPVRTQRNTEKSATIMRQDYSYNNLLSREKKENLIDLEKSRSKKLSKQRRQSRGIIEQNRSIYIEKQKPKTKKKRERNPRVARRLRKCFLAVYFSIFFPSFSRKIYINKLKAFMLEYPHDVGKYYKDKTQTISKIKKDEATLWAHLESKLDIIKIIEQAKLQSIFKDTTEIKEVKVRFQLLTDADLNTSQRSIPQSQTLQEQLLRPKSVEYLLSQFSKIATKLIDNFGELVKNTDIFISNWKSYSQGILNNSFINNSHPKLMSKLIDSGMVRLNLFKQTLQVFDEETESMMLIFDIFFRIYCFNWFCKLKDNLQKYSQEKVALANFFLSLLYIIGEMMVQDRIRIYFKQKINFEERQKKRNKKIRPILPLMVRRKLKNDLKDVNRLIYDPPMWKEVSTLILDYKQLANKIQTKMTKVGTQLYVQLRQCLNQNHRQIKHKTVKQKYIILNDKERPQNLQKYENLQTERTIQKLNHRSSQVKLTPNLKAKLHIRVNRSKDLQ